ncbi:predicted protein [Histoplasma capsulatum G186AR]|uniref:Uncharacterized protein n=1 Tax=Ajellomyces capsulatus (strain G186AR / H82 / ATCC MYA-2454 / RMSCC 2432) TaxID=447093 RepID=C0NUE2_AJECG|nr:uncharacterized protein HCBG_06973 [Histoplasma capsulatum G186AR]EEH05022.1 predicted protein [Histoplasma capsulatum G186AR]
MHQGVLPVNSHIRSNELPAKGKKKQFYIESCLGGKIATVAVAASYILDIISALVVTNFVTKLHPELGWMDWQRMSGEGEQHEPLAQDCLKRGGTKNLQSRRPVKGEVISEYCRIASGRKKEENYFGTSKPKALLIV